MYICGIFLQVVTESQAYCGHSFRKKKSLQAAFGTKGYIAHLRQWRSQRFFEHFWQTAGPYSTSFLALLTNFMEKETRAKKRRTFPFPFPIAQFFCDTSTRKENCFPFADYATGWKHLSPNIDNSATSCSRNLFGRIQKVCFKELISYGRLQEKQRNNYLVWLRAGRTWHLGTCTSPLQQIIHNFGLMLR